MRKLVLLSMVCGSTLFLISCSNTTSESSSPTDTTATSGHPAFNLAEARATIEQENQKFMEEVKRGDSLALAAHYASDAQLLPPNSEPIKKKDIAAAWGGFSRMGIKELKINTKDFTGNAELLAETGTYELLGSNNQSLDKGKYLVVWKKENGNWKIYRDIFNTSLPRSAK